MQMTLKHLSYRHVLHTSEHLGHIDVMHDLARQLGYPCFLWNDRVYRVTESHYEETSLTRANVF